MSKKQLNIVVDSDDLLQELTAGEVYRHFGDELLQYFDIEELTRAYSTKDILNEIIDIEECISWLENKGYKIEKIK